jgi:hypothetical protein
VAVRMTEEIELRPKTVQRLSAVAVPTERRNEPLPVWDGLTLASPESADYGNARQAYEWGGNHPRRRHCRIRPDSGL